MGVDLKNLTKLIALCRKTGVSDLEVDGIKLRLSPSIPQSNYKKKLSKTSEPQLDQSYTDEDVLLWSAGAN